MLDLDSRSSIEKLLASPEVEKFIDGLSLEVASSLEKDTGEVIAKMTPLVILTLMTAVQRINTESRFILEAEKKLFNLEAFTEATVEEKREVYNVANKALQSNLEFFRKFLLQNRDFMASDDSDMDEIRLLLKKLPSSRKRELLSLLKGKALEEGKLSE